MDDQDTAFLARMTRAQKQLIALIVAVTAGGVAYRWIVWHHLEQTSLLFIGLPAIMAIVLVLAPPAKSAVGGTLRGITIFLLMCGPVLGEGFICILMMTPIFLVVGLVIAMISKYLDGRGKGTTLGCCLLLVVPMSLEGTSAQLSFSRFERVQATAVVAGTVDDVRKRMEKSPRVDLKLPPYLRMGFPRPVWARGEGLAVGDTRTVHVAGGEGMPGDLIFRVVEAKPGEVRFEVAKDECTGMHSVGHWATLREADVHWQAVDATTTRVTWEISYERRLDPAWYFGPWERYAGRLAARYLIDANAGPR